MTTRLRPVDANWDVFWSMSLERGVPEAAATELRRAFYAGADLLLTTILHNLTSGSAAEDADVTLLKDVQADIERFAREVAEGRR